LLFAQASEIALRHTCKSLARELAGQQEVCDRCQRAKQRAKVVSTLLTAKASKPGQQQMLIDTSEPYEGSLGGSKYWVKIKDEYTRKSWGSYAKRKSEVPNIAERHMKYCKGL
jgi:hypothetical protein